jgi:hypothetical protein
MNISSFFDYLLIGFAILLPMGVLKYLIREKYAQQLLAGSEVQRLKVLKSTATLLKMLKWFLYLSPLILPYGLYKYAQADLLRTSSLTVLLVVTVGLEYLFRKWLFNRLRSAIP